jgi:hypothetical protein
MSTPVDFNVSTGRTWKFLLTYYADETETTVVNLTGYSVRLGVVDATGAAAPGVNNSTNTFATVTNAAGGVITVNVPFATTATWAVGEYYYDLALTNPSSEKETILSGTVRVKAGYAQ